MILSKFLKEVSVFAGNLKLIEERFALFRQDFINERMDDEQQRKYEEFRNRFETLSSDLLKFRDELLAESGYGCGEELECVPGKDGLISVGDVSFRIKQIKIEEGGFACTVERLKTETPKPNTEGTKNE